jgi:hypothetical protein
VAQIDRVVALLDARRTELTAGEDSIGIQESHVAEMEAELAAAQSRLNDCRAEVESIDYAIGCLTGGDA